MPAVWKDLGEPQPLEDSELLETVVVYVDILYCYFEALVENEAAQNYVQLIHRLIFWIVPSSETRY